MNDLSKQALAGTTAHRGLRMIDVPTVLLGAAAVSVFTLWFARFMLLPADAPLVLPPALTSIKTWIASAGGAGSSWLFARLVAGNSAPSGERYMAWIFGLAIGTVILSLLVRHSLAAKDESVAQASPELVTEYPSVGVFLDHNDRTVIPAAQLQWQEPAWDSLAAYLKSPTFQNSIKTFVVREKWQGAKFDDVMAVQTNQVGATACNHMVRNGEAFAVHPKIPCGSRLTVRANDRSIVVPVWDRPATTTPWLQIQLGLSTKAMQELGLSGKAQLSFEVTSTPSS